MKKLFLSYLLIHSLFLKAQPQASSIQFKEPSDSTEIGQPDGNPVSKEIGPAGGSIISEDGRMELIFPAGALSQNTTISIQPATNLAPNGSGKSYHFEPSGIQFKKPVQLILHYTDEEYEGCYPDLMGFAMQSKNGKWSFFNYDEWDSAGKQLKGHIQHFSYAANVKRLELKANFNEMRVGTDNNIHIWHVLKHFGTSMDAYLDTRYPLRWFVNDKETGDENLGFINTTRTTINSLHIFQETAIYTAPSILPRKNPVTIKVFLYGRNIYTNKMVPKWLQCKIDVYDVYSVSLEHETTLTKPANLSEGVLLDKATCVVVVYPKKVQIVGIKNFEPSIISAGGKVGAVNQKIHVDGVEGSIHLDSNYTNYRLSQDRPPEVYFNLKSHEITLCKIQMNVKFNGGMVQGPLRPMPYNSIPHEINFIANGKEQIYDVNIPYPKGNYKLIVKPVR